MSFHENKEGPVGRVGGCRMSKKEKGDKSTYFVSFSPLFNRTAPESCSGNLFEKLDIICLNVKLKFTR